MRGLARTIPSLLLMASAVGCYRLPLRISENDATGYEDVGVPLIEAVEYTPAGRDLRVSLEAPGYVTIIIVDPERGASVRFKRGDLQSQFAERGLHRYPLDRLASPMLLSQFQGVRRAPSEGSRPGRPAIRQPVRQSPYDISPFSSERPATGDSARREFRLASRSALDSDGAVTSAHVVVIVSERPLDLVRVATRLARGSLDPAIVAQSAADVVEGGRWMAASAQLRGQ